jgi:hypothetical protein
MKRKSMSNLPVSERKDAESKRITVLSEENNDIDIFESETTEKIGDSKIIDSQDTFSKQRKFDAFLVEAIDEALTSLGIPVKNTIYFQLENNFNIPKDEIPKHIDEFTKIIHKMFGLGAKRLEIKFLKNLHSKIKINIELTEYEQLLSKWLIDDTSFVEYIYIARNNYFNKQ